MQLVLSKGLLDWVVSSGSLQSRVMISRNKERDGVREGKSTYNIVDSFPCLSHALSYSEILTLFFQDMTVEPQVVFSVILARAQPSRTTWLLPAV